MISRIQAVQYRCFAQLDVTLHSYNVLAGANGTGKSTLIDIPLVLSDMLAQGIIPAFLEESRTIHATRAQSLQELTHRYRGEYFGFALEIPLSQDITRKLVDSAPTGLQADRKRWPQLLRYEVRFQIFNKVELQVADEFLYLLPETGNPQKRILGARHPSWRIVIAREMGAPTELRTESGRQKKSQLHLDSHQLALANVPLDATLYPATVWFVQMLGEGMIHYEPDVSRLRTASPPGLGLQKTLMPNAQNLPWLILNLKQEQPQRFEAWVDHVKTALPNLVTIDAVRREEDYHAYLKLSYEGGYTVTSSGLSAGTLRILALTLLPYLSNPPRVLSLEEPEDGIHPRAIDTVLQSLSSLYHSQVWLSTHSPFVLAHTPLEAVIIMRRNRNGGIETIPGDKHPRLRDWSGDIDLGTLFASGVLE
ncbi:MAG TPA: AAA family ATPase [Ktedonobacteraceae bacterium]|jgi:predicted ATPase